MTEAAVSARALNFRTLPLGLRRLGRKIAPEACCLAGARGRGCTTPRLSGPGSA